MFRSTNALLILIAVLAFVEYYAFTAINTAFRSASGLTRSIIIICYLIFSVASLIGIFTVRHWNMQHWNATLRTLLVTLLFAFILAKILMAVIMCVDDIRRIFIWIYQLIAKPAPVNEVEAAARSGISRSQFIARAALLTGGLLMGGFLWGTGNKYRYKIKRVKLALKGLPDSFKGMKIVQISDIHSGSFDDAKAVSHGVDLILKENADLILFTGDLVNDRAEEIVPYKNIFAKLKAPMGVYSTLGNHDYGDYVEWESEADKKENLERLKQHHADMGWKLMMNEHQVFERGGEKIALIGIENWSAKSTFPKHGKMKEAYEGLAGQDVPVKILMSHDPSHWDAEVRTDYSDINLTLSGHTHGMQFGLLLPWMKWSPVQYMYKEWAGLYTEQDQHLYVNVGYGFLGYPGRLGIMPEITVFELV